MGRVPLSVAPEPYLKMLNVHVLNFSLCEEIFSENLYLIQLEPHSAQFKNTLLQSTSSKESYMQLQP